MECLFSAINPPSSILVSETFGIFLNFRMLLFTKTEFTAVKHMKRFKKTEFTAVIHTKSRCQENLIINFFNRYYP